MISHWQDLSVGSYCHSTIDLKVHHSKLDFFSFPLFYFSRNKGGVAFQFIKIMKDLEKNYYLLCWRKLQYISMDGSDHPIPELIYNNRLTIDLIIANLNYKQRTGPSKMINIRRLVLQQNIFRIKNQSVEIVNKIEQFGN